MPRPGLSYDQVAQAATDLSGRGERPTIRAVRLWLGGTGSPNTIHAHLQRWQAETARPATERLPAALEQMLLQALAERTAAGRAEAAQQVRDTAADNAELARQNAELLQRLGELEAAVREREEALATERDRTARAQATVATLETQRDQQRARAEQAEITTAQTAEQARLVGEQVQALTAAQVTQTTAKAALEQQLAESERQRARLEARAAELTSRLAEEQRARLAGERQVATVTEKLATQQGELTALRVTLPRREAEREQLAQTLAAERAASAEERRELRQAQAALQSRWEAQVQALREALSAVEQRAAAAEREVALWRERGDAAGDGK